MEETGYENWDLYYGYKGEYQEIYKYYIIMDEIVCYNDQLDMYVWDITHFGTSWDYVLIDIKLV